jgi:hypothetical protein
MAGTTTNYGWTYPTSTDLVKDGATAIQTAIQGADTTLFAALGGTYPGLRLIKTQTIGSAVASVTVTGAFSTTYDAYQIVISGGVASANNHLRLQMGTTASNYAFFYTYGVYSSATVNGTNSASATSLEYAGFGTTSTLMMNVFVDNPFLTKNTNMTNIEMGASGGSVFCGGGYLNDTTSYTSFTVLGTSTQTLTGGTIAVYGYGKS